LVEARKLALFVSHGTSQPCATTGRMGTRQATGTHTGAGRQYADAIETGICADGSAHILHTDTESAGLWRAKTGCLCNARLDVQNAEWLVAVSTAALLVFITLQWP